MRRYRLLAALVTIVIAQVMVAVPSHAAVPSLTISNRRVLEGNSGQVAAVFTIKLSASSASTVTVAYATKNGTAVSTSDYVAASGSISFPPGTLVRRRTVEVNGDTLDENNERLQVRLSGAQNATIADGVGVGTIVDDDCTEVDAEPNDTDGSADNLGTLNNGGSVTTAGVICPSSLEDHFSVTGQETNNLPADFSMTVDLTYNAAIAPLYLQGGLVPGSTTETSTTGSGHEQITLTWADTAGDDSRPVYVHVYGSSSIENSYTLKYTFTEG
jgi:Calx-beta domain-containing protein